MKRLFLLLAALWLLCSCGTSTKVTSQDTSKSRSEVTSNVSSTVSVNTNADLKKNSD